MKKEILLSVFFGLFLLYSLGLVSAAFSISQSVVYINRTQNTIINLSILAEPDANITFVNVSLFMQTAVSKPQHLDFVPNSNLTTANATFSNSSGELLWNTTTTEFLKGTFVNGTRQDFLFNITPQMTGDNQIAVTVTKASGLPNSTLLNFTVNFAFTGYVKNETGGNHNGTNASIYQFVQSGQGPPTELLAGSVLTDENGSFTFASINGSADQYKLKLVYYNESGTALKVGTTLPPFPATLFYPASGRESIGQEFMKQPTLNGTTFYIEPAATINITAITNSTTLFRKFGYEIMEQKTGFPVESNIRASVSSAQVIVPLNRRYTIMVLREPSQFAFSDLCDGIFLNDTTCPTPPKSNSTTNPTTAGQIIGVQFNLTVINRYMYGCINVIGNLTAITNITFILPKMLPWPGFVPPVKADSGNINLSDINQLNTTNSSKCAGKIAWYNISLMSADYLVEFYGANTTGAVGAGGEYFAAFQNVTISNDTPINITLLPLAGVYTNGSDVNTSKIRINLQNSNGSSNNTALTSDTPHAELYVKHSSSFGELHYIVESMANGTFYMPILAASTGATAKLKIFPNQAPPSEKTLNISLAENNVTLITMTGGDMGLRKINASGGLEQMNTTTLPINMRFLRAGTTECDVANPPSACEVTSMTSGNFNPLKALVAGKINMEMKLTYSNVTLSFFNFDMFSAKQPPMHSVMNDQASGGASTASQIWEFGSFVPAEVYDYVIVGIPYTDAVINDSRDINMTIPYLYDENWNVVWNHSAAYRTENLTSSIDDYLGNANNRSYNSSGYRNFLTSGVICSRTDSKINGTSPSVYCYVNTSANMIYMRVPHFSGLGPSVTGSAPAPVTAADTGGGGGASVNATTKKKTGSWVKITPGAATIWHISDKDLGLKQIAIMVNNEARNVKIIVTKYEGKPANVTKEFNGTVYKYIQIEPTNLENLSEANITMQIEKSWITDENILKQDISLFKFDESTNQWVKVTTTYKEEDSSYYYYEAKLSGFSYFVIGEKAAAVAPTPTPTATPAPAATETPPVTPPAKVKTWVWIALIVVIAIVVVLIVAKKRKGKF